MIDLIRKYEGKLVAQGVCDAGAPLFGALDAELIWNRDDAAATVMEEAIAGLNIASILYSPPAEPYFSILNRLAGRSPEGYFVPGDSETRTFFHDIPVSNRFDASTIIAALKRRRSIFIRDHGIVTYGTVSPEQAFVVYSSVCFSAFVKFFTDALVSGPREDDITLIHDTLERQRAFIEGGRDLVPSIEGPYRDPDAIYAAIIEAGRLTVERRMVDSYFGNISYRAGGTIYISQTAAPLDELAGCVDPVPDDNRSTAGITASSELPAHRRIYEATGARAILHGHPKFAVAMSMLCGETGCPVKDCWKDCPRVRMLGDTPVVAGEIGAGGLAASVRRVIGGPGKAVVYGHGVFTVGREGFEEAFRAMAGVEAMCREEYFRRLDARRRAGQDQSK